MYSKEQVTELFDLLNALKDSSSTDGCPPDLTTVDSVALYNVFQKAGELKALNQKLFIGLYEHRHGVDTHNFLIPDGVEFSNDDYRNWLDDFEPNESAEVNLAELIVIEKNLPVQIQITLETADDCEGIETFDENGSTGPMAWDQEAELETVSVVIEKIRGESVLGVCTITGDQWREIESNGLVDSLVAFALEGHFLECFDTDSDLHKALVSQLEEEAQKPKDRG